VTFLFTDIEGSTRLWEEEPAAMSAALAQHDDLVRGEVDACGGHVFKTVGDASALDGLGELCGAAGDWEGAARWAAAAEAGAFSAGISRPEREQVAHDRLVAEARQRLGEEAFARAWSQGGESRRAYERPGVTRAG
jgi:class 3 adenylate cyclase